MQHAFLPNAITYVNLMQMLCNEYENKTYELHKKIQPCHRMIKQNRKKTETKSEQVNSVFIFCCCVWLFNDVGGGGGIVVVCCDAIYLVRARIRRLPLMSFFFGGVHTWMSVCCSGLHSFLSAS